MTAETIETVIHMCMVVTATSVAILLFYLLTLMRLRLYVRHEEPFLLDDLPAQLAPGREVADRAWRDAGFTRFARLKTSEFLSASGYQKLQTYLSADGMSLGAELLDSKDKPRMIYSFYRNKPPLLTHSLALPNIDLEFIRLNQVRRMDLPEMHEAHRRLRGDDPTLISSTKQVRALFHEESTRQQEWMQKNWFTIRERQGVYRASMPVLLKESIRVLRELTLRRVLSIASTPRKAIFIFIMMAILLAVVSHLLALQLHLFFLVAFVTLFVIKVAMEEASVFLVMLPSLTILATTVEPRSLGMVFFCAFLGAGAGKTTRSTIEARKRGGTMGGVTLVFAVFALAMVLSLAHMHATLL